MMKNILANDVMAPPPPPPPTPSKSSRKMLMAIILIIIIVVAAVAAVLLLTQSGSPTANPSPSPNASTSPGASTSPSVTTSPGATVSPSATETPSTSSPSPSSTNSVSDASSMQFSVSYISTEQGVVYDYTYYAKNMGTSNMMMRIDGIITNETVIYIVNGAEHKSWIYSDGEWTDMTPVFDMQYELWNETLQGYQTSLLEWVGTGEYTFTYPVSGDTLRIYNIAVNPQLPDSLFQH